MSLTLRRRSSVTALVGSMALTLTMGVTPAYGAPWQTRGLEGCKRHVHYNADKFSTPLRIDNKWLPLRPGTQLTLQGVSKVTGRLLGHTVTTTITDLTKVVNGVKSRVIYEVDRAHKQKAEAELAFFAQDDKGRVWNLGEYPEEYEDGEFVGAPSTWIAGLNGAEAGIHMLGSPHPTEKHYLQGLAEDVEFLDCAKVIAKDAQVSVPAGDFSQVLVTDEISPFDGPDAGSQQKYHAAGVGVVHVGFKDDPQGELLDLVKVTKLSKAEMRTIRKKAMRLERHGLATHELYCQTPKAKRQFLPRYS